MLSAATEMILKPLLLGVQDAGGMPRQRCPEDSLLQMLSEAPECSSEPTALRTIGLPESVVLRLCSNSGSSVDNNKKEHGRPRSIESDSPGMLLRHATGAHKVKETLGSPRKKENEFKMQPQNQEHLALKHEWSALPVSKECA